MIAQLQRHRTSDGACRHCGRWGPRWLWWPVDDGAAYHVVSFTECCSEACYRCKFDIGRCPEHKAKGA